MEFLALFVSLPTRQSAGRMRIWRALRALGCATLRDGVYLLPDSAEHAASLAQIAENVLEVQGTVDLYRLVGRDEAQQAELVALFDRGPDYARLLETIPCHAGVRQSSGTAHALRREFKAIVAIDYFPGEAQQQVAAALAELAAVAGGEPRAIDEGIRRLASADFSGRTWATRKHLWVDRMASAWLIRRFIDTQGEIPLARHIRRSARRRRSVSTSTARPSPTSAAVSRFRSAGGELRPRQRSGHRPHRRHRALPRCRRRAGGRSGGHRGRAGRAARAAATDDDKLLTEASRVFDGLYKNYRQEKPQ